MKKIFLVIFIFLISFGVSNADSGRSIFSWGENSGASECGTSSSHGVTHFGVPSVNTLNPGKSGRAICVTHTYSKKYYTVPVAGKLTACNPGDRALAGTKLETRQECKNVTKKVCHRGDGKFYKEENGRCFVRLGTILNRHWSNIGYIDSTEKVCENNTVEVPANGDIYTKKSVITCEKYDDTPPTLDDIGVVFNNTGDVDNSSPKNLDGTSDTDKTFVRADVHNIDFNIKRNNTDNSANIANIKAKVENKDNPSSWDRKDKTGVDVKNFTDFDKYTEDLDFSKIDGEDRNDYNYRVYTYKLEDICDEAGNCLTHTEEGKNGKTINFNVFANFIDDRKSSISKPILPGVADGQDKEYSFTLKDKFGNNIVPVKFPEKTGKITQIRDLNFTTNYSNSLFLDQYSQTGRSGMYSSGFYENSKKGVFSPLSIGNHSISKKYTETSIKEGNYGISFKPYSPTYDSESTDGRQFVDGNFGFTDDITVKLKDKAISDSLASDRDLQFKPKIYTEITGEIVKNNNLDLIVGARQDSKIELKKNGTSTSNGNIYLEYGYIDKNSSNKKSRHKKNEKLTLNFEKSSWLEIASGYQNNNTLLTLFGNRTGNFLTILTQKGTLDQKTQNTYLATHIIENYPGIGKVIYNSHILGMDRYFGNLKTEDNTFQRPLKIIGNTHSLHYSEVVSGDNGNKLRLLGNVDKAELQKNIRKKVVDNIRNLSFSNGEKTSKSQLSLTRNNFSASGGRKLGDTIYFEKNNGENIEISGNYIGVKNIVIYGGNAYITGDITAGNKKNDILSIISVEKNGKGGNIFIKNTVTKVESILYADKSLLTTDNGSRILTPKNGGTYRSLKNQLYIYGSIFSNNTIGGTTGNPPICPYFVNKTNCNQDEAQKYDLYNFRRGYENLYQTGKEVYKDENLKDEYKNDDGSLKQDVLYPLIIEYNPLIQTKKIEFFQIRK